MAKAVKLVSGYLAGLLIGGAVFGGVSLASTGVKTILAHYANIAIHVNGKTIATSAEPFIYNYNVYVPISTIAHGLGAQVAWNGAQHQVQVTDENVPSMHDQGVMNFYNLEVYGGAHVMNYQGQNYISGISLATAANQPIYVDSANRAMYIGKGPASGMPINAFYDVRDYGDYALYNSTAQYEGPAYGWNDGAPVMDHITFPNANSLVWAAGGTNEVPGVEYNLNGAYTSLTGAFGLDDSSDGKEQAQLTITGDGQQLYQSPWKSEGQPAENVSVNVTGVHLLTIAFAVKTDGGNVYNMGQTLPKGYGTNINFADVNVH